MHQCGKVDTEAELYFRMSNELHEAKRNNLPRAVLDELLDEIEGVAACSLNPKLRDRAAWLLLEHRAASPVLAAKPLEHEGALRGALLAVTFACSLFSVPFLDVNRDGAVTPTDIAIFKSAH